MSWTPVAALSVIAVAGLAAGPLVHDEFTDSSTTSNPTAGSVGSCGCESSFGGAFTPFARTGVVSTLNMWARSSTTIHPDSDENTTGADYVPTGGPLVGIIFPAQSRIRLVTAVTPAARVAAAAP